MAFSEQLREWRLRHKLTQKEAAAIVGAELNTYRGWEYGHHEPSSAPCRICAEQKMKQHNEAHQV